LTSNEAALERRSLLLAYLRFLVDYDVLAHEAVEPLGIHHGIDSRDLVFLSLVDPHLQQILQLFLEVESLQVINDRHVVDVATTLGDVLVAGAGLFSVEVIDQLVS